MKNIVLKIFVILSLIIFTIIIGSVKVKAATFSISSSPSTIEPGENFSVTINTNGAGYVNLNCSNGSLNENYIWVEGSKTVSGKASNNEGKVTISATGVIADFTSGEDEKKSGSTSITVKKKEQPKQETPATTTTPATPAKPATTTTTTKTTTTKKTETKTETKKTETPKVEEKKQEEDNFYINSIRIKGLKESGEQVQIELSPEFKKDVYEYTCNIPADVKRIDVEKDAGEFTNSIIVNGTDELKEGENIITLQLSAEDHQAKIYTIKANKEKKEQIEEVIETAAEITESNIDHKEIKDNSKKMIQMPVWSFVLMQILIIGIEIALIIFIPWSKILRIRRKKH